MIPKKKQNILLIIPAFLLIGIAVGIQTQSLLKQSFIGLIVGILIYFFLRFRNKKIRN